METEKALLPEAEVDSILFDLLSVSPRPSGIFSITDH